MSYEPIRFEILPYYDCQTKPNENDLSPTKSEFDEEVNKYKYYKKTYYDLLEIDRKLAALKIDLDSSNNSLVAATNTTTEIFNSLYDIKTTLTDDEMKKLTDTLDEITTLQGEITGDTFQIIDDKIEEVEKNRKIIHGYLMEKANKITVDGYWCIENLESYEIVNEEGKTEKFYNYDLVHYCATLSSNDPELDS